MLWRSVVTVLFTNFYILNCFFFFFFFSKSKDDIDIKQYWCKLGQFSWLISWLIDITPTKLLSTCAHFFIIVCNGRDNLQVYWVTTSVSASLQYVLRWY